FRSRAFFAIVFVDNLLLGLNLLRRISLSFAILLICAAQFAAAQTAGEIRPAPYQVAWQDLEFGVIVHFSTNTFLNQEWGDGTAKPEVFNPTQFDPEQWMK